VSRAVAVAVPVPLLDALTYRVPDSMALPVVGARVRVPLGSRIVTGCVVAHIEVPAESSTPLKDVAEVLDQEPFLPASVTALCAWVADYYLAGIGDAIGVAFPPGARVKASGHKMQRVADLTAHGRVLAGVDGPTQAEVLALTPTQRMALDVLSATSGLPMADLRERGVTADVVGRLAARGLVTIRAEAVERDPFDRAAMATVAHDRDRTLTAEQAEAVVQLTQLADSQAFRVALLHGVTGSGKTEIYIRLADHVRRSGRQSVLLVPEIALTPSMAALLRGAFGTRVAIQHSGLSAGERHDQWQRIRHGDVDVVVGTRSAVFAPVPRLGLVVVDEEHDGSYKQEEAPRYHGRDVAVVRGSREQALVVLGSATPSLETYQNAVSGKYTLVTLARRVLDRPLADVRVVNMREEYAEAGPDVVMSRALVAALEDRLGRREQAVLLLNRRGYATAIFCRQCGDPCECPNCSVSLTVHSARHGWRARCHYCDYSMTVPKTCPTCAAPYMEQTGFGTERVEQAVLAQFPQACVGRVDRDSVRRKGALSSLLSRFAGHELDILVGTQMIAKGHDFPGVTLVGVISADVGLGMADFRAGERTFQLLTQVAGRAGRGERRGEAFVQTLYPEHYSIALACRQDYAAFFEREVVYRRGMRYPPFVALVNVVVRGRTFEEAMRGAADLVRRLEPQAAAGGFILLGPAPAPLTRLRGEHRVQFFLKGSRRADMRAALRAVMAEVPELRRRVTIDVDPLTVL
jgi:primosomal protein N' (replication factor Y) (superfamily II helicase)